MAKVELTDSEVLIELSLIDEVLAFHGVVPHSDRSRGECVREQLRRIGAALQTARNRAGYIKEAGIFTDPAGIIFVDISGGKDVLVIETRGERFPRIAVSLPPGGDPDALAHQIMARIPDSGPVE